MRAKDEKSAGEGDSDRDDYNQDTAVDNSDDASEDSFFLVEDDISHCFPTPNQEDVSRQGEVETIFASIFGRVGCYNCGLGSLDVKLSP